MDRSITISDQILDLKMKKALGINSELDKISIKKIKENDLESWKYIDNVRVSQRSFDSYLRFLNLAIRVYISQIILGQLAQQVNAIINPMEGSNQVIVNICYSILSITCIALFGLSFKIKQKQSTTLLFVIAMLSSFRMVIRIIDFEETQDLMTDL